jgi:uncharacterized protein (DUF1810 family)
VAWVAYDMKSDGTGLDRFLQAQAPVYDQVQSELVAGRKASHWMWFIFPQLGALGRTSTARFYGIGSAAEALAYWQHPVLGSRLKECAELVLAAASGLTAHDIFGTPDDLKLRSSMTLFAAVAPEQPVFGRVLERFYGGEPDQTTLGLVK